MMKYCIADWHYPHRTFVENLIWFSTHGFDVISVLGSQFVEAIRDEEIAEQTAFTMMEFGKTLTVHGKLPADHSEDNVEAYRKELLDIGAWQKKHGYIRVLSFDVPEAIRGGIVPYVKMALDLVPGCRIAVEDYGLTEAEADDVRALEGEKRFGYLIDIGHMNIRLAGKNTSGHTLFTRSEIECGGQPFTNDAAGFLAALRSKPFPVVEIHFHNNDNEHDLHLFLEDGSLNMEEPLKAIRDFGFEGILTIESAPGFQFPCYGQEADDGIMRTYKQFKEMVKNVYEQEKKIRVLMLGNSFTFYHDMPKILENLSGFEVESITKGGAYLKEQLDPESEIGGRTLKALTEEKWDYVVLQEQSKAPAFSKEEFQASVKALCEMIRGAGAKPVLYATWAYRDDTEKLRSTGVSYEEMLKMMTESYHEAAEKNDTLIADVGLAFDKIHEIVDMYMADDFHPSPAGSVLAAEEIARVIREDAENK